MKEVTLINDYKWVHGYDNPGLSEPELITKEWMKYWMTIVFDWNVAHVLMLYF